MASRPIPCPKCRRRGYPDRALRPSALMNLRRVPCPSIAAGARQHWGLRRLRGCRRPVLVQRPGRDLLHSHRHSSNRNRPGTSRDCVACLWPASNAWNRLRWRVRTGVAKGPFAAPSVTARFKFGSDAFNHVSQRAFNFGFADHLGLAVKIDFDRGHVDCGVNHGFLAAVRKPRRSGGSPPGSGRRRARCKALRCWQVGSVRSSGRESVLRQGGRTPHGPEPASPDRPGARSAR